MSDQEKAVLLAAGEEALSFYEEGMDKSLHSKNFPLAWNYERQHDGAAYMMKALGLLSYEEYKIRTDALFDRYIEAYSGKTEAV